MGELSGREVIRYWFWGWIGLLVILGAIITIPIWVPSYGLVRLGKSFYTDVVK